MSIHNRSSLDIMISVYFEGVAGQGQGLLVAIRLSVLQTQFLSFNFGSQFFFGG